MAEEQERGWANDFLEMLDKRIEERVRTVVAELLKDVTPEAIEQLIVERIKMNTGIHSDPIRLPTDSRGLPLRRGA